MCPIKSRSKILVEKEEEGRGGKGRDSHQEQGGEVGTTVTARGSSEAVILSIRF